MQNTAHSSRLGDQVIEEVALSVSEWAVVGILQEKAGCLQHMFNTWQHRNFPSALISSAVPKLPTYSTGVLIRHLVLDVYVHVINF